MKKVITYGTFDLLHRGHIRLLERAKALGDYLIVGVTSDNFDRMRGKINNQQTLMERVEAVRALGLADEILIEEYEGQKIDDIRTYGVDIFTVGSDWEGTFDYLRDLCEVVYLPRTEGVSSSDIRTVRHKLRVGLVGWFRNELTSLSKFIREAAFVNGIEIPMVYAPSFDRSDASFAGIPNTSSYDELLDASDAVYIASHPTKHYEQIKAALFRKKHVLCEAPLALSAERARELIDLSHRMGVVLMEHIKTAHTTAFSRMLLLVKSGKIGQVVAVDATCTSLKDIDAYTDEELENNWNTICEWGPVALLPVFRVLGNDYTSMQMLSRVSERNAQFDTFTKMNFVYPNAVASVKIGKAAKSEGSLVISGTKGYIYVPAPWWKTDYFEVRYENPADNQRYFYQLDGEGIRNGLMAFLRAVETEDFSSERAERLSLSIASVMEDFYNEQYIRLG